MGGGFTVGATACALLLLRRRRRCSEQKQPKSTRMATIEHRPRAYVSCGVVASNGGRIGGSGATTSGGLGDGGGLGGDEGGRDGGPLCHRESAAGRRMCTSAVNPKLSNSLLASSSRSAKTIVSGVSMSMAASSRSAASRSTAYPPRGSVPKASLPSAASPEFSVTPIWMRIAGCTTHPLDRCRDTTVRLARLRLVGLPCWPARASVACAARTAVSSAFSNAARAAE